MDDGSPGDDMTTVIRAIEKGAHFTLPKTR
jgi:hypothetical protein